MGSILVLTFNEVELNYSIAWRVTTLTIVRLCNLPNDLLSGGTGTHLATLHSGYCLVRTGKCNLVLVWVLCLDRLVLHVMVSDESLLIGYWLFCVLCFNQVMLDLAL